MDVMQCNSSLPFPTEEIIINGYAVEEYLIPDVEKQAVFSPHFSPAQIVCNLSRFHTAAADPGMSTTLRSVGLLDRLSSLPPRLLVARLASTPVCTASRRNLVRSAG